MQSVKNKTLKDFGMVISSNILVLVSNILTGLVVPKLLGVTNYGYYKIFTLYLGYTALLHFGFVDGILLMHGGEDYRNLDKEKFRRNTKFFAGIQAVISLIIIIVAYIAMKGIYRFIFVMLGIDTITTNLTSYYQYVSQCTLRFKELSTRKVYQAGLRIAFTLLFFVLFQMGQIEVLSASVYIGCLVLINVILLIWYVVTYKDITFGKAENLFANFTEIVVYFKKGIILTIAFQVANLIFNLDRQFVSIFYDTETYARYSFAYSLISMATTVIGAVSLVLFPNLKRKSEETIIRDFSNNMALIALLVFAAHIGYYPLCGFIKWFLPDYAPSLIYLRIIFPGLAISSCISAIIFTYYKVLNKNTLYFIISCGVLALSAFLNGCANTFFHSPSAISWASVVSLLAWYLVGELFFVKKYNVKWIKNLIYIVVMSVGFYSISFGIENAVVGTVVYTVLFMLISFVFYRKLIFSSIGKFSKKIAM